MAYRSFETEKSINNEKVLGQVMIEHFGRKEIWHTPKYYPIDSALIDENDEVREVLEIKYRTIPSTMYETFSLDLTKYQDMLDFSRNLPTYLVVKWSDGKIGYCDISTIKPTRFKVLKRHNKRYEGDYKIVVELPINEFVFVQQ